MGIYFFGFFICLIILNLRLSLFNKDRKREVRKLSAENDYQDIIISSAAWPFVLATFLIKKLYEYIKDNWLW